MRVVKPIRMILPRSLGAIITTENEVSRLLRTLGRSCSAPEHGPRARRYVPCFKQSFEDRRVLSESERSLGMIPLRSPIRARNPYAVIMQCCFRVQNEVIGPPREVWVGRCFTQVRV